MEPSKLLALLLLTSVSSIPLIPDPSTEPESVPFLGEPEVFAENRSHHLYVGRCGKNDILIHSETIIINNDGTSRTLGDIKINVEGPVFITCVKVLDQVQEGQLSGAYPSYIAGGVGYNYIVLGFKTAYGYSANFYVEVHGYPSSEI